MVIEATVMPVRDGSLVLSVWAGGPSRRGIVFGVSESGIRVWWDDIGETKVEAPWDFVLQTLASRWKVEVY